jgi:hypothetical protein
VRRVASEHESMITRGLLSGWRRRHEPRYQVHVVGFSPLIPVFFVWQARYDADYDVRDRARYLRMLVPPDGDDVAASALAAHAQVS